MENLQLTVLTCALALVFNLSANAATLFKSAQESMVNETIGASHAVSVELNRAELLSLEVGDELIVRVPAAGTHRFIILHRSTSGEVELIQGVLAQDRKHHLLLGVRHEGVSGVISTTNGVYSLGYVNNQQWLGVAGAADAQLLAQYKDHPTLFDARVSPKTEVPPVVGAQPITLNLSRLADMAPGDQALLTLADMGVVRVSYEETRANADSASWVGYLSDFGKDFRVILTYSPTGTTGHILGPQGEYSIETTPTGATYLIDPRKSGLRRNEDESCQIAIPSPLTGGVAAASANEMNAGNGAGGTGATTTAPSATASATALAGATTIDILVLYTPGFEKDKGGSSQALNAIDNLIAITNQAYIDSGVAIQLRRVGADKVAVADNMTNGSVLTALTNGTGAFSGVKARRDALGADMVSIVRPFYNAYHAGCGIAWIGGYGMSPISNSSGNAYSVVSEGRDRAGSGWYCDVTSFAHELGHNQGLMHDRATVARQGGGVGATSYAYGYGSSGIFGTVMSYLWPKVGKFSNPNLYTCKGNRRCGLPSSDTVNGADNAKALNFTRASVAGYRTASTTKPHLRITGLITVNGLAATGTSISGAPCVVGLNGVYQCTVPSGFTGTLVPSYVRNGVAARFAPSSRGYKGLTSGQVNQNFVGTW